MVRIIEEEKKREADPITQTLFLRSIRKWYNKEGVHVGVEKTGNVFRNPKGQYKGPQIPIKLSIIGDMPKCISRELDEQGQVVYEVDDLTDKKTPKLTVTDDAQEVTLFMKLKDYEDSKGDEEEYFIHSMSSVFPLLNFALKQNGDIPEDNDKNFILDYEELTTCLEGLEFLALVEEREFNGSYDVLIPKEVSYDEIDMVDDLSK